jgi:antitoxin YefM
LSDLREGHRHPGLDPGSSPAFRGNDDIASDKSVKTLGDHYKLYEVICSEGLEMNAVTYSQARENLAETMDKVCDDHSPIIITRKNQRSVVMISLEDYQALEETAYLLRSPKNARRVLESIAELQAGGGTV